MNVKEENLEEEQKKLDDFGLDRARFEVGAGDSQFFKLKDKEKVEITIVHGGVRQELKQFKKFENGQPVKDEHGNDVVEREGDILVLDVDTVNGEESAKTWEITSKKLATTIFSFLDKREKDGTPYLFSRKFHVQRQGTGKETSYIMYPTEPRK